jgi:elongator complex protein 6
MPTPIPSTLSPFIQPSKPGSLTLLTSVLDATSNWLLLRYLYAALRPEQQDGLSIKRTRGAPITEEETTDNKNEDLNVILVSFLRPFELWKEMAKKIVGLPTRPSS